MSVRLYVGNLPEDVDRQAIEDAFTAAGTTAVIKLITDRKTNKCRGFGFVTVPTDEEADQFIEKFNGLVVGEITLKIEKALPRTKEDESSPAPASAGSGKRNNKKGGNKQGGGGNKVAHVDAASLQPDPRWASALEQLKAQLAQTTS